MPESHEGRGSNRMTPAQRKAKLFGSLQAEPKSLELKKRSPSRREANNPEGKGGGQVGPKKNRTDAVVLRPTLPK
ncbi:MAG: hypothetical protein AAB573_04690 [Patescibacteria group bacterium]